MKTLKEINRTVVLIIIAATLIFTSSCKKPDKVIHSPWHKKSSDAPGVQSFVIDMSTYGQNTAYGLVLDQSGAPLKGATITHNGGLSWHFDTVAAWNNIYPYGFAATTSNTVHMFGWSYLTGGGNMFRSNDGGTTWEREGANTYTNASSFPDAMQFFNPNDGVVFGDPVDGYFEIYTTNNGGNSWSRVPSDKIPAPLPTEAGIPFFSDSYGSTVWIVLPIFDENYNGLSARLLQSDDKGSTWYVRNASLPFASSDGTMKFRDHSIGLYKNNQLLYRTTDGGTTYNKVNYSGTWFSFDFDNIPGKPGWWVSTGGFGQPAPNSPYTSGSSITYDDGNNWTILDTAVDHTCVDMTGPNHGYSGGITTGSGNDGVFMYSDPNWHSGEGKLGDY